MLDIEREWTSQVIILSKLGILTILPVSKELGITGIDGKEYPVPRPSDIIRSFEETGDVFETKLTQYENPKLILEPFACPIDLLIKKYGQTLIRHFKEGLLFDSNHGSINLRRQGEGDSSPHDATLDKDFYPIWRWSKYIDADKNGALKYFPESFSQNHGGKTKAELLKFGTGWRAWIVEDLANIPGPGEGKITRGRRQLESGLGPGDYLEILQNEAAYRHEHGLTAEAEMMYAVSHLEEQNQIINDLQGNGTVSYSLSSYFSPSGEVTRSYFHRGDRQVYLCWNDPDINSSDFGARLGIKCDL